MLVLTETAVSWLVRVNLQPALLAAMLSLGIYHAKKIKFETDL